MRILYVLRVTVISLEALILAVSCLSFRLFDAELESLAASFSLNDEILKYLMLMPIGLAAWIFNESRALLQEDNETILILTGWEDYWKLKAHTWVGLGYAVLFVFMSLMPWVSKSGVSTGIGFLLFVSSVFGQLALTISIYVARIRAKEILVHAKRQ